MSKTNKCAPEVRERAVRMVLDHEASSVALGGAHVDFVQDRLHGADAKRVGEEGRDGQWLKGRADGGYGGQAEGS